MVGKVVTGISIVRLGTVICFSYSDGTVEYRERSTMAELWTVPSLDRINSIHEAGFTHGGEVSCECRSRDEPAARLLTHPRPTDSRFTDALLSGATLRGWLAQVAWDQLHPCRSDSHN